ncbi:MAG TPA: glycosyltransferase [Acidimicrobiales bacterium]|nr:glycosyltransferase [Acidimicrobiales bacterium]
MPTSEMSASPESGKWTAIVASVVILGYRSAGALERCLNALAVHRSAHPFETIVVLNGSSGDVSEVAERHSEVTVVRSVANRGFAGGCNLGASRASGRYLVFLNDDAVVTEGWLDGLVHMASTVPLSGAVASLVMDQKDRILEFGGGMDHLVPSALERGKGRYRAELVGPQLVAYASGCSLLVERDLFDSLGGFDERFYPAYFEDADLSRRIWEAGRVVAVTPASVVQHIESHSTNWVLKEILYDASRGTFESKWSSSPDMGLALPEPLPRIVYVDDCVPRAQSGSGLGRARSAIEAFASLGVFVQMVPVNDQSRPFDLDQSLRSVGVAKVRTARDLNHLPRPLAVVVSRPHNFRLAQEIAGCWENVPLIYDAEALFSARVRSQMLLPEYKDRHDELAAHLAALVKSEKSIAQEADAVVAICQEEATWFREHGRAPVRVLDPFPDRCDPGTAGFAERSNAVFVAGWMAGGDSPNADAVRWLAKEVMPRLNVAAPDLVIEVTGSAPPVDLLPLQSKHLRFIGEVSDLTALLDASRVAIAPLRYGAGVKLKVVDALARGLPVVATTHGAAGLSEWWRTGVAVADDPSDFAAKLSSMANDASAWDSFRIPLVATCNRHASDLAADWAEVVELASRTNAAKRTSGTK